MDMLEKKLYVVAFMKPDAETHVFTVIWSLVPLLSKNVCTVFLETTTVPDHLSIATLAMSQ